MNDDKLLDAITKIDQINDNQFANLKVNKRYLLLSQIGKGTFGVVYKAKDLLDHRPQRPEFLAIKIMVLPKSTTPKDLIMESEIKDEIKKYSNQIFNSRVVNIKDSFEWNKLLFIVMEYVDGQSLKEIIKLGHNILTTEEIIYYFSEIALAIQGMHDMKMIHRDLKPDNILLTSSNKIKITDFGISHIKGFVSEGGNLQKTKKPSSPGTPRYSSPEQYLDTSNAEDKSSYQADIYSLGVMMYEAATGASLIRAHDPAFNAKKDGPNNDLAKFYLTQTLIKEIIPPSYLNPRLPNSLENIIMKCLEKNPEDRYGTAQSVYDDLNKMSLGQKIHKNYKQLPLKNEERVFKNEANTKFSEFNKTFFKYKALPGLLIILIMVIILFIIYIV